MVDIGGKLRRIVVIGARGSIGSIICSLFEDLNFSLLRVVRKPLENEFTVSQYLNIATKNDVIIDVSTMSLNEYFLLATGLEKISPVFIHFSSIRALDDSSKDHYSIYKRSVLEILKNKLPEHCYLFGDLFHHNKRFLGYWKFASLTKLRFVFSTRPVTFIEVTDLVKTIETEKFSQSLLKNSNSQRLKTIIIQSIFLKLGFRLRLNKFFRLTGVMFVV